MWLYFITYYFESSLGSIYFFFLLSCVLGVLEYFFFFLSFIFLEVVQKTFGEVNETICNLFWFFSFGGDPKPFEGNRMVSLTLKNYGLGPWRELFLVYWQWGDISICEIIKHKYKHYSSECFSIALRFCFPACCNYTASLALGVVGQSSILVQEPL